MNSLPEVRIRLHETREGTLVHRARSADGQAVSVRTTHGAIDYVRVGSGAWGGSISHPAAVALYAALHAALGGTGGDEPV